MSFSPDPDRRVESAESASAVGAPEAIDGGGLALQLFSLLSTSLVFFFKIFLARGAPTWPPVHPLGLFKIL